MSMKSKKREVACQASQINVDVLIDEITGLRQDNHDLKHGLEYYKEKCEEQKILMAKQNQKLATTEEIAEKVSFFLRFINFYRILFLVDSIFQWKT